jgi:cob(I)alamin adenosyltransferase
MRWPVGGDDDPISLCGYNLRQMKIYTRTGDAGETALFDGSRVSKADPRVEAYGHVDELNAVLGLARAAGVDAGLDAWLDQLQRDLFALGAQLADPASRIAPRVVKAALGPGDTARLEQWIDSAEAELPPLRRFVLPGGTGAAAALHLARTICRRAERHIVGLGPEAVEPELLAYVNRLSDLLFVLARLANARAGAPDKEW